MNTQQYLDRIKSSVQMNFIDFIQMIQEDYEFSNIAFENNGLFDTV